MGLNGAEVVFLLLWLLGLYALYWVLRLAVRHGIEDVERRRNQPAYPASSPPPHPPGGRPEDPARD